MTSSIEMSLRILSSTVKTDTNDEVNVEKINNYNEMKRVMYYHTYRRNIINDEFYRMSKKLTIIMR